MVVQMKDFPSLTLNPKDLSEEEKKKVDKMREDLVRGKWPWR